MKRFSPDLQTIFEDGRPLIVGTAQRAAAVRSAYADEQIAAGNEVWATPIVQTFEQWALDAYRDGQRRESNSDSRLLTAREEWALFRSISAGLVPEHDYLTRRALAKQLRVAVRLMDEWQLDRTSMQRTISPETALLTDALQRFEQRCLQLNASPLRRQLAGLSMRATPPAAPATLALPGALRSTLQQHRCTFVTNSAAAVASRFVGPASVEEECVEAVRWCEQQLRSDPRRRLLLVAPDLHGRRDLLERTLSQVLEPTRWLQASDHSRAYAIEGGRMLVEFPMLRQALQTLRLLSRPLQFTELSAWLQAPYGRTVDADQRALLDRWLRKQGQLELNAQSLAGSMARAPKALRLAGAQLAQQLRGAVEALPRRRGSSSHWAQAFTAALHASGWPGERALNSAEQQTLHRWQELLVEFASLGFTAGDLDLSAAVDCLADLAADTPFEAASRDVPVIVTDSLGPPVARYDGIWVMGLNADQWPPPPAPHALLPTRVQIDAGIETANAIGQRARAGRALQDWSQSTELLVYSAPLVRDQAETIPSVLVRPANWRPASSSAHRGPTAGPTSLAVTLAGDLTDTSRFELLPDTQGTAWNPSQPVTHGVTVFDLQTRCPFRAYAELRLDADRLELPEPGIDPRDRGLWLHKALELFWQCVETQARLMDLSRAEQIDLIEEVVGKSRTAVFPHGEPEHLRQSLRREQQRLSDLLLRSVDADATRPPFAVRERESKRNAVIGGGQFRFAIDRIDHLDGPTGAVAIIDYKSGRDKALGWLRERLLDPQLLVYAKVLVEEGVDVRTLARLYLTRGVAKYVGRSATAGTIPGVSSFSRENKPRGASRHAPLVLAGETETERWRSAIGQWQAMVDSLAREYLAGHAAVDPYDYNQCKTCHLTTLCRRAELPLEVDETDENDQAAHDS
ncbi:MAG TPA: PD-(D/E)XK nuclease family protein [Steroidobacteraceae bacterium]|nr:PD-(D/E)XK nuclease family protein [Steroidobacteraceae bacterium]